MSLRISRLIGKDRAGDPKQILSPSEQVKEVDDMMRTEKQHNLELARKLEEAKPLQTC